MWIGFAFNLINCAPRYFRRPAKQQLFKPEKHPQLFILNLISWMKRQNIKFTFWLTKLKKRVPDDKTPNRGKKNESLCVVGCCCSSRGEHWKRLLHTHTIFFSGEKCGKLAIERVWEEKERWLSEKNGTAICIKKSFCKWWALCQYLICIYMLFFQGAKSQLKKGINKFVWMNLKLCRKQQ